MQENKKIMEEVELFKKVFTEVKICSDNILALLGNYTPSPASAFAVNSNPEDSPSKLKRKKKKRKKDNQRGNQVHGFFFLHIIEAI